MSNAFKVFQILVFQLLISDCGLSMNRFTVTGTISFPNIMAHFTIFSTHLQSTLS